MPEHEDQNQMQASIPQVPPLESSHSKGIEMSKSPRTPVCRIGQLASRDPATSGTPSNPDLVSRSLD